MESFPVAVRGLALLLFSVCLVFFCMYFSQSLLRDCTELASLLWSALGKDIKTGSVERRSDPGHSSVTHR